MKRFKPVKANSNGARRGKWGRYFALGILALFILLCAWYGVYSFFEKYQLQSPVVFRPIVVKREPIKNLKAKPAKPRSKRGKTKKAILPEVEASTPLIESYPKYLTEQGNINRNRVLALLNKRYDKNNVIAMDNIFKKESGYRADAINEIGAGGICQAYPYTKMDCELTTEDLMCQVEWCLSYVKNRYGTPIEAWNFHLVNNWF